MDRARIDPDIGGAIPFEGAAFLSYNILFA